MMKTKVHFRQLTFDRPRGTSRGWLEYKPAYYLAIRDESTGYVALGEAGVLPGLSIDDKPNFERKFQEIAGMIERGEPLPDLSQWPAIGFAVEMALAELANQSKAKLMPTGAENLTKGIEINGLVWMGDKTTMQTEIDQKIECGFRCIKLKIGAIDFEREISLIKYIRRRYHANDLAIRVDANGAFATSEALEKLQRLAELEVESIEQPIRQGQASKLAELCAQSPIPIALDEELIGISHRETKAALLDEIRPQFIVLKPSLLGGMAASDDWIEAAESRNIGWWVTSALESNVGLNAIAQYTASKNPTIPQGLGTGMLYTNNIESPLVIRANKIYYDPTLPWKIPEAYERF